MKRVLVVDDNAESRYLLDVLLKGHGYQTLVAENGATALHMARQYLPDLVITDILMPVMDGYSLCREWKDDPHLKKIPFIFYTATYTQPEDREFAIGTGADRFVIKPQDPAVLIGIVADVLQEHSVIVGPRKPDEEFHRGHSLALARKLEKKITDVERLSRDLSAQITERRRLEEKVAAIESKFHEILDAAPLAMTFMDMAGEMLYVSREFVNLFGFRYEDLPNADVWFSSAYPDVFLRKSMRRMWEHAQAVGRRVCSDTTPAEAQVRCKDGSFKNVSVLEAFISDIHLTAYKDLSEHRALVSQLIRAQRMEALGHVAGGLVHDFNNILLAIEGYGQLLITTLSPEDQAREYVEKILSASDRGEKLTHSLFSFGRKQQTKERPIALNRLVIEAEDLLKRLVRQGIELRTMLCAGGAWILADPNQIEQVLMNLVKNASDAIEGTGTITIGTQMVVLGETGNSGEDACTDGHQVLMTVTDTGHGMGDEVRKNIFEPFFTSKAEGKGTGLGLSVVHGIVQRHKGHIAVKSAPGKGSRFSIYFPTLMGQDSQEKRDAAG
jgi:PAS domain S-box-containing protein